jgi:cytochrome c biogenesis protein CcmG/thiol:disulfide interchange protein DsbE
MTSRGRGGVAVVVVCALALLAVLSGCSAGNSSAATNRTTAKKAGLDIGALPACPATSRVAPRADGLPALTLRCLGAGPSVRLSDLRGTPMVFNVWAAWCTNCDDEAPYFATLHREAGDKVRFFGLHYKAPRGFGLRSARDFGLFYPSVHDADGDKTVTELRTPAPPATLFVTADGRVAYTHIGVLTSQRELDSYVATYLGVKV